MDRALRFVRSTLESTGEVGVALSVSLVALQFLWLKWELR